MAGYVGRIELPGGESSEVYNRLHFEMGRAEFYPYFVSIQDETLELPHATYVHEGRLTSSASNKLTQPRSLPRTKWIPTLTSSRSRREMQRSARI
ncbi:MAG: hypothetical protein JWM54_1724 [Acidobacteriaceae bacterium]|nr:hypothetical protein [Acidobacteriaceae bacterium]